VASIVRIGWSSGPNRETAAVGTTAPVGSVTRMRSPPVCAKRGEIASSRTPTRAACLFTP
jgi:hypothetical protein